MNLVEKQKQIIVKAKKYLNDTKSSVNTALSTFCFYGTWDETPGWSNIKFLDEGLKLLP